MIVGYGNNNVLLLGMVREDLNTLEGGLTLTFEQVTPFLTGDVVVVFAETKALLLEQLALGGVSITQQMREDYHAGKRTDRPRKAN